MEDITGYRLCLQQKRLLQWQKQGFLMPSQLAFLFTGETDKELVKKAIGSMVLRSTTLRTTYSSASGIDSAVQVIGDHAGFQFVESGTRAGTAEIQALIQQAGTHQFDPEHGPMVRADYATTGDRQQLLILTFPAICADYRSLGIIEQLFMTSYGFLTEESNEEAEVIIPYHQFSEWQNQLLETEEREEGTAYWKTGNPPDPYAPVMPFDEDPYSHEAFVPGILQVSLPGYADAPALYGNDEEETPEPFLALCWQLLLWQFTGRQSLTTGHIHACRDFEELYNTIGSLSKTLPVSAEFTGQSSFNENLLFYRQTMESNDEFKAFYEGAGTGKTALFPFVFEFVHVAENHTIAADPEKPTCEVVHRQTHPEAAKIQLRCIRKENRIFAEYHYNKKAFSAASMQFVAAAYTTIVTQCAKDMGIRLSEISVMRSAYGNKLLESFTTEAREYPETLKPVNVLMEEVALKNPSSIALVCEDRQITYHELHTRADSIADHLCQLIHVEPGDKIGLMCAESEWLIIGMLAIIKAGCAYVPIDPETPSARVGFMLEDCAAKALVTEGFFTEKNIRYTGQVVYLDKALASQPLTPRPMRRPDMPVYVIYTSGTTGNPKGVIIPDHALINYVCWLRDAFSITSTDSSVLLSSFAYDLGYTAVWGSLLNGGCLHIVNNSLIRKPDLIADYIARHNISFIKTTPSLFHLIAHAPAVNKLSRSHLRLVILGGEPLLMSDVEQIISIKPDIELVNHYGPTECTIGTVAERIDKERLRYYRIHPVIGRPIANSSVSLIDENNEPVAPGINGELCVSGPGLALGYLNREQLTEEKFVAHPLKPGTRMYRTGDIARWMPDGKIVFVGRKDDQVKIRGHRVELNEVQLALLQVRGIRHAAVIAVNNDTFGKELVAYIAGDQPVQTEEIRAFLTGVLPEAMIPSYFIQLKTLPLTPNGKIDKRALPDPASLKAAAHSHYIEPRNELERKLVEIWIQVLGFKQIGIRDNFFDLGGHSLKAIQLSTQLHKQLGIKIDIGKIFSHPTIEQLGAALAVERPAHYTEIMRLPEQEYYELSHAQQRIWILSHLQDGSLAYSAPGTSILEGRLQVDAFKHAFTMIIARHENLRTVFIEIEGEPRQKILPVSAARFDLREIDVRQNHAPEKIIDKWIEHDAGQQFDLEHGPLLRAILIRTAEERYVFVFNIHHIVSDGWSREILLKELFTIYNDHILGIETTLPPLRLQYRDYAAWHTASFEGQGSYWHDLYKDHIPVLNFPLDFERPHIFSFSGARIHGTISEKLTQNLKLLAGDRNMTLHILILSLYGLLVARYSRQEEVVIGSLVSGRSHPDLENLTGVFINFLPIKLSPKSDSGLDDYLKASHRSIVRAYQNQDYPFDLMVENCIRKRDLSRNAFFDTMVNFHLENDLEGRIQPSAETFSGIQVTDYQANEQEFVHSVLDFKLDIIPTGSSLSVYLDYNRNLFTNQRMEGFLAGFIDLLEKVVDDPGKRLPDYVDQMVAQPDTITNQGSSGAVNHSIIAFNICASFSIEPLLEYVDDWNKEMELELVIHAAPYNQVFQQLLDPQSILNKNGGINALIIRVEDWLRDLKEASPEEQMAFITKTSSELTGAFVHSREIAFVPYLVGIVPLSPGHLYAPGVADHIMHTNQKLESFLTNASGSYMLDLNRVASLYAVEDMFDPKSDELGHMPFTMEYYAALGTFLARQVRAWKTPAYKIIAVDCDNTLWKGVCGEDGTKGLVIDKNYTAVQEFLLEKYKQGFLLALCSKNNEEDVWDVFDHHPHMKIKREHIAAYRLNWQPKPGNLAAIAKELNAGLDSVIFLDDSSFETEQMAEACPAVLSLALPADPGTYTDFLNHIWAFDSIRTTKEDLRRNAMVGAEKKRKEEQLNYTSLDDFLQSLDVDVQVSPLKQNDLERAAQLTQRTNQFNMNGVRKTEEQIAGYIRDRHTLSWSVEVKDRFGDYGFTGLLLATVDRNTLVLESFMLSCRVLGRKVEHQVLAELRNYCRSRGIDTIQALFQPTQKNKPFSEFLEESGWVPDKDKVYNLLIEESRLVVNHIQEGVKL